MRHMLLSFGLLLTLLNPVHGFHPRHPSNPASLIPRANSIQTAAETNPTLWIVLAAAALICLCLFFWLRSREKHKD